ncbi:MAG: 3-ketoacyl-ACP reductase [Verrucomicrobia bacterium]|nr:MAG: 3-ketoacyl-ACP reductase [Verrucomicrobiota bacterium]
MAKTPVILVTGASRGLGRGIALSCAQAGYSVAVHYAANQEAAEETCRLCDAARANRAQKFIALRANLAVTGNRLSLVEQAISEVGRLDALVNNAGMAPRTRADVTETSESSYQEVMDVNLTGPFFLSQLAARYWLNHPGECLLSGGYKLIFITSISADTVSLNRAEYCISKAGLAMVAQLWAARLANYGVQVFDLRPGIMETDMTAAVKGKYDKLITEGLVPQMRWGKPEDVGLAVEAILRGALPFSTGAVIPVDGGFHLKRL